MHGRGRPAQTTDRRSKAREKVEQSPKQPSRARKHNKLDSIALQRLDNGPRNGICRYGAEGRDFHVHLVTDALPLSSATNRAQDEDRCAHASLVISPRSLSSRSCIRALTNSDHGTGRWRLRVEPIDGPMGTRSRSGGELHSNSNFYNNLVGCSRMSSWLGWRRTSWISGMLPGSQVGRPRLSVAGFGREGYVRGRAESGCSFFEVIWRHWPALTESSSPLENGEPLRTRPSGALRWGGPRAT